MPTENTNLVTTRCPHCDLRDKHIIAQEYYIQFINRTDSMFEYSGLPETIPDYILERYLKVNGWCGIGRAPETASKHAGELVCFFGGLGQKPDLYYQPTAIILANPVLGSKEYEIGVDCVWAKNDSCNEGISKLMSRYAHMLAENDISTNIAQITTRMPFIITAETQNEYESAKKFVDDATKGEIAVVKSSALNNGITPQPTVSDATGGYIKALIELHQYIKAQFYNDIGIGSNFNMKRERQNVAEVEANSPALLPLIDEMLKFRKKMCDEVNDMFGESWSVKLSSAWELENLQQNYDVMNDEPGLVSTREEEVDEVQSSVSE